MREILFRGKTDKGEWVEGYYVQAAGMAFISAFAVREPIFVFAETVGQYTGLTDNNGNKIFEGDIAKVDDDIYVCFWNECNYEFGFTNSKRDFAIAYAQEVEVIGNIHDNPELIECEETGE